MEITIVIVLVLIKLDAEAPTAFPCFFVGAGEGVIGGVGGGEGALAVGGGEVC